MSDPDGYVRIREAAIALFADRGTQGVSIMDIAATAGVSGGLIRHHFGSKEQLRQACDRYVFEQVVRVKEATLARIARDPTYVPTYDDTMLRYYRYTGRATMDGSASALRHFELLVSETTRWLVEESGHEHRDPHAMAAVLAAYSVGLAALLDTVARTLAVDPDDPALLSRVATASAAIFTTELLPPGLTARLHDLTQSAAPPPLTLDPPEEAS